MITIGQKRGYFITFEGSDGSGKSTQIDLLRQALQMNGFKVKMFREPGGNDISEAIRDIVKNPKFKDMCSETELMLMSAARAQLVRQNIKPALAAGEIVLCDRFFHSTIVYQGFGRGLDQTYIKASIQFTVEDTTPDVTFILYLTPEEVERRRKDRGTTDRIEAAGKEFATRVDEGFAWLVNLEGKAKGKIVGLNASGPVEDIHNEIYRCVASRISECKEGQLEIDPGMRIKKVYSYGK